MQTPSIGQTILTDTIKSIVNREYTSLLSLYTYLHQYPELSLKEQNTSAILASELIKYGFSVTEKVGGYGVAGVLKNGEGPVVMIRTDMDALPLKEETGLDYASKVIQKDPGSGDSVAVMHACGHDMHMAVWTGTARVLASLRQYWKGAILFVAQPAEESGTGAKAMIEDGLFLRFPRPDYALALHVSANMAAGKVGYCPGYFLANIDALSITVKGKGGHGAVPQATIDPIVLASKIVLSLQTIVSREISPLEPAVITVGSIQGGEKENIIPGEVKMRLTVRSFKDETRSKLIERIKTVCEGTAMAAGLSPEDFPVITSIHEFVPSLYNDPALTHRMATVFEKAIGAENVIALTPEMVGEDFGRYGREEPEIPIMIYSLGTIPLENIEASKQKKRLLPPLHSAKYFPETAVSIPTGILTMSAAVLDLLDRE